MLFEFKSRATGSVIMTDPVGRQVLSVLDRPVAAQGIITVAQLPEAIRVLRQAIAAEREAITRSLAEIRKQPTDQADANATDPHHDEEHEIERLPAIRFEQRVIPLIEMFERSLAAGRDVTWGV